MKRYRNLSGNSGVIGYEIAPDAITIEFEDGGVYRYTYQSAGRRNIEKMKTLAVAGKGLSSFIVRQVRKAYATKLR